MSHYWNMSDDELAIEDEKWRKQYPVTHVPLVPTKFDSRGCPIEFALDTSNLPSNHVLNAPMRPSLAAYFGLMRAWRERSAQSQLVVN